MKIKSIKSHLKAYSITGKRKTTINHAFASAIAPNDEFDEQRLRGAMEMLGQDPDEDLICVFCGDAAETWDHVFGLVKNSEFSGYGHIIGNLLPCCKKCNSEKGNKNWQDFIKSKPGCQTRSTVISKYLNKYLPNTTDYDQMKKVCSSEINKLDEIKGEIFMLMQEADSIAVSARQKIRNYYNKML